MELRTAIQKLAKQDIFESILGTVVSVDSGNNTCTVQPLDDQPEILEVRLSAIENPTNGIIPIPATGSIVIVGQTPNDQPHILMFSELDDYSIVFDTTKFIINPDGLKLTVGTNDFKEGMQELKTAIGQLQVMTAQGQSSIPINITAINAAFDKVLNTLQ